MIVKPRAGFDWDHVTWGRPYSVRSALCSYCSAAIGEDDTPMVMWKKDGHAAQFCDDCMKKWFGFVGGDFTYEILASQHGISITRVKTDRR